MAKKIASQGDTVSRDTLRWTDEMDTTFLDGLLEECGKGNRVDGTFTTTAYDNVLAIMRSLFGNHLRKDHLKNRLKTLKDHFGVCYDLFHGLSGFSWNPITKMFQAEDEVWEDLIKAKPGAKKWMRTPIKHYDKLFEIYGTDRATGKHAGCPKDRVKSWDKNKETIDLNGEVGCQNFDDEDNDGQGTPHSTSHAMGYSPEFGISIQSQRTQGTSKGTKRKASLNEFVESEIEILQQLTNTMKEGNYYYQKSIDIAQKQAEIAEKGLEILQQSKPRYYSANEVWAELEKLGIMADLRRTCYRFLCRNDEAKQEFFGVPAEERLNTLYELMKEAGLLQEK